MLGEVDADVYVIVDGDVLEYDSRTKCQLEHYRVRWFA
jgi:hypothetical protein